MSVEEEEGEETVASVSVSSLFSGTADPCRA